MKRGKLAFERDRVALHRFRVRTYAPHADQHAFREQEPAAAARN